MTKQEAKVSPPSKKRVNDALRKLEYEPVDPANYRPGIGLIGCGGITVEHLAAYRNAGYRVLALCDLEIERAKKRRDAFFPDAEVYEDYKDVLARQDIEVADITTHPPERLPLIEAALTAGKHVLSQKPFVLDLDDGERLVKLAAVNKRRLAVNQNGRWAPHFSYLRAAVAAGALGQIASAHLRVHWDHGWVKETAFNEVEHLVLYDFAIHWFDMVTCVMGAKTPKRVYASAVRSTTQQAAPPLLAQALIEYDDAQASLAFDGDTRFGPLDESFVTGSGGVFHSTGPDLDNQTVTITTAAGVAKPKLKGQWFPDGFHGTMAELLRAIDEDREPSHSAANNLRSLALCFAAVASRVRGEPVVPGEVRRLPGS